MKSPVALALDIEMCRVAKVEDVPLEDFINEMGPDYPGAWDGQRMSEQRIIEFCQNVYDIELLSSAKLIVNDSVGLTI